MHILKSALITAATVTPLVVIGLAAEHLPAQPSKALSFHPSGLTTQSDESGSTPSAGSSEAPAVQDQSTPSAPANNQIQAPAQQEADQQPAVTAVDTETSDWSAPIPNPNPNATPNGTEQYKYCVYTYSDGSTQQRVYQTKDSWPGITSVTDPGFDCTVATAP